jgi:hypothetical protein
MKKKRIKSLVLEKSTISNLDAGKAKGGVHTTSSHQNNNCHFGCPTSYDTAC